MELQTISQVSKSFSISTRTLRYYEQIGLLPSIKKEEYAYRTYDKKAIARLQQIIVLRKLRVSLKQIGDILQSKNIVSINEVFNQNLAEVSDEIATLSTIKSILVTLISRLNENAKTNIKIDLLNDESILQIVNTLVVNKINLKEEKSVEDLKKASEQLSKLKDVRVVYLPPASVAASHYIGENPEENASKLLDQFVREIGLDKIKPDLRHYGFNHPNPSPERQGYGYEMWVTIPENMEVPLPLIKKEFQGGLYAAHMISMGNFHEWEWLYQWVQDSTKYEINSTDDNGECMQGCLEEHINYINHIYLEQTEPEGMQLDLLIPIKEKI